MLIFKLGYNKAIVPPEILPLIPQIIPVEENGGVWVPKDNEVEIAVDKKPFAATPAAVEEAKLKDTTASLENYQRWYAESNEKIKKLQEELDKYKKMVSEFTTKA